MSETTANPEENSENTQNTSPESNPENSGADSPMDEPVKGPEYHSTRTDEVKPDAEIEEETETKDFEFPSKDPEEIKRFSARTSSPPEWAKLSKPNIFKRFWQDLKDRILMVWLWLFVRPAKVTDSDQEYKSHSQPFIFNVTNKSKTAQTVDLLGTNKYLLDKWSEKYNDVEAHCSFSGISYTQLLQQFQIHPVTVGMIRLQSGNSMQIMESILMTASDANGVSVSYTLPSAMFLSPYQFQSCIVDIPISLVIDGGLDCKVNILPESTLQVCIFPADKNLHNYGIFKNSLQALVELSGLGQRYFFERKLKPLKQKLKELFTKKVYETTVTDITCQKPEANIGNTAKKLANISNNF